MSGNLKSAEELQPTIQKRLLNVEEAAMSAVDPVLQEVGIQEAKKLREILCTFIPELDPEAPEEQKSLGEKG